MKFHDEIANIKAEYDADQELSSEILASILEVQPLIYSYRCFHWRIFFHRLDKEGFVSQEEEPWCWNAVPRLQF